MFLPQRPQPTREIRRILLQYVSIQDPNLSRTPEDLAAFNIYKLCYRGPYTIAGETGLPRAELLRDDEPARPQKFL